jgi:hypothetical protein
MARTPFAEWDGVFYVCLNECGIGILVAGCDGLSIKGWDGDSRLYIELDDAIMWHHKEQSNPKMLDMLKRCRERLVNEHLEET